MTYLHNSTNSFSSIVPDLSTSKHSKQKRRISSFVNMQYVAITRTYSSNSIVPDPSISTGYVKVANVIYYVDDIDAIL